jgi:hypothetical protein
MRLTRSILADRKGLAAAIVAVVALGATAGMTLGGFSATIENPTNTFSSGTIQLEEGVASTTCFSTGTGTGGSVDAANTGTCSSEDDLGAALDQVPGGTPVSTTVTLTNVGNVGTTASELAAGACTTAAATDDDAYVGADTAGFCGEVDVTVANTTTGATDACVYPTTVGACPSPSNTYTLASMASTNFTAPMSPLAASASATYVFTVELDPGATNADQGLTATIPLTWSITQ